MRLATWFAVLGIAAVPWAESISPADECTVDASLRCATRAKATVEFFEDSSLVAVIDVVSELLGEQGNGLGIAFSEADLSGAGVLVLNHGPSEYGVLIDDSSSVPYEGIARAIDSIAEVSADLRSPPSVFAYEARLQNPPSAVQLTGGADAVVPEPSGFALAMVLCALLRTRRCRETGFSLCRERFQI